MPNTEALTALNEQWSSLRRWYAVAIVMLAVALLAGGVALVVATRSGSLALLLAPALLLLFGGPVQDIRALRAGAVPAVRVRMSVSLKPDSVCLARKGVSLTVPLSDIRHAAYVLPDIYAGPHWLSGVLRLDLGSHELIVPESSEGFTEFLDWCTKNRNVTRSDVS